MAFGSLLQLAPLVVLRGGQYLSVFKVEQLQALAYTFLQLSAQAFDAFIVFFGFYCVFTGYLIFRSTFVPRIVGALMVFAGLGYLTLLSKPLATYLSPYNLAPPHLGNVADAMAARDRRERSEVGGAGQSSWGTPMKAAVYRKYGPPAST